jgi:hypothetical protein
VVNMGNDGDIAYRLGHRCGISFSGIRQLRPLSWLGEQKQQFTAHCGTFYCISRVEEQIPGSMIPLQMA